MEFGEGPEAFERLLHQWKAGDVSAFQELIPIAYQEIKRLAVIHMSAADPAHTLQPTALVHEVYRFEKGVTESLRRQLQGSRFSTDPGSSRRVDRRYEPGPPGTCKVGGL